MDYGLFICCGPFETFRLNNWSTKTLCEVGFQGILYISTSLHMYQATYESTCKIFIFFNDQNWSGKRKVRRRAWNATYFFVLQLTHSYDVSRIYLVFTIYRTQKYLCKSCTYRSTCKIFIFFHDQNGSGKRKVRGNQLNEEQVWLHNRNHPRFNLEYIISNTISIKQQKLQTVITF